MHRRILSTLRVGVGGEELLSLFRAPTASKGRAPTIRTIVLTHVTYRIPYY